MEGSGVYGLAVSGSDLYAAGVFTTAGGTPANQIAKWNGSSWTALGSGLNGPAVLAISGSDLFAGGKFTTAGGKVSAYVAHAYLDHPSFSILRSSSDVTLWWPSFYGGFVPEQNPDVTNPNGWSTPDCLVRTTNGATISATAPVTPGNQFFRLKEN
jgi:hypothetical protein